MVNQEINLKIWQQFLSHPRLGEILIKQKRINIAQLGEALEKQKEDFSPIGEVLMQMGLITKNELVEALELQLKIDKILSESFSELRELKENGKVRQS